jgi:SH3-like domain-containing protein
MNKIVNSLLVLGLGLVATPVAAAAATPPEPAADSEVPLPEPKIGRVTARTLNVRVSPSTDRRPVTTIKRDRKLKVVARKGEWLKIELPGDISTWVMSKYLTVPEGQEMPLTGTVNAQRVRLRAAGDLKAAILRELPRGLQLEVVDRAGDWFKVRSPAGTWAWIFGKYVKFDEGASPTGPSLSGPVTGDPGTGPAAAGNAGDPAPEVKDPGTGQAEPDTGKPAEVLTGTGVQQFSEAETALRQARAEQNPDLVKVFLMYYQVAKTEGAAAAIKDRCESRMKEIAAMIPGAQRKRIQQEVKLQVAAKLKAIDAAAEAAKGEIPKVAPKYTAVGYLDNAPVVAGIPGTHKLTISGVLLYYLRAAGSDVDLGALVGRKVGVIGRKRYVKGWGIQVIDVSEVRPYRRPPSTRAWVEPAEEK